MGRLNKIAQAESLSVELQQNINKIQALTGNSSDIAIRQFQGAHGLPMAIVYVLGLTNSDVINDNIMKRSCPTQIQTEFNKELSTTIT